MTVQKRLSFPSDPAPEVYCFDRLSQNFPAHFHDQYLLGRLGHGRRLFISQNIKREIGPNDLVALNPFQVHACLHLDDGPDNWFCIRIPQDMMRAIWPSSPVSENKPLFTKNIFTNYRLCQKLTVMIQEYKSAKSIAHLPNIIGDLIADIVKCQDGTQEENKADIKRGKRHMAEAINRLCKFLETEHATSLSLADMSRCAGMSKFRLLRTFAAFKGITPYRYLENLRLNHAQKLLRTGMSIAETAIRAGFYDQSHLHKSFTGNLGVTPGAYVRNLAL